MRVYNNLKSRIPANPRLSLAFSLFSFPDNRAFSLFFSLTHFPGIVCIGDEQCQTLIWRIRRRVSMTNGGFHLLLLEQCFHVGTWRFPRRTIIPRPRERKRDSAKKEGTGEKGRYTKRDRESREDEGIVVGWLHGLQF